MQTGLSATWCKRRACVDCHLRPALRALDWVGMDRKPALLTDDQDPAAIPILFCLVQDEDEAVQIRCRLRPGPFRARLPRDRAPPRDGTQGPTSRGPLLGSHLARPPR